MLITVEYCVCFGKNDYSEWIEYDVEINDNDAALYKKHIENKDELNNCDDLKHILWNIYDEIYQIEKENLSEYDFFDCYEEDCEEEPELSITIQFIDPTY